MPCNCRGACGILLPPRIRWLEISKPTSHEPSATIYSESPSLRGPSPAAGAQEDSTQGKIGSYPSAAAKRAADIGLRPDRRICCRICAERLKKRGLTLQPKPTTLRFEDRLWAPQTSCGLRNAASSPWPGNCNCRTIYTSEGAARIDFETERGLKHPQPGSKQNSSVTCRHQSIRRAGGPGL